MARGIQALAMATALGGAAGVAEPGARAIRGAAAVAIAGAQDALARLKHAEPMQREAAAWDLGFAADPASVPALRAAVGDKDAGVRRVAAWALAEIGTPDALATVYGLLQTQPDLAPFVLRRLETTYDAAAQRMLVGALHGHPDAEIRARVLALLDQNFTPELLPEFQRVAEGEDDALMAQALPLLVKHKLVSESDELVPTFVRLLKHADPKIRLHAVRGLRGFQDEVVRELLERAIADADREVHETALSALASMVDELSLPRLVELYDAGSGRDRATILGSVSLDRRELMAPLYERALNDAEPEPRRRITTLARYNRGDWVLPILVKGAGDADVDVREDAAAGLGRHPDAPPDVLGKLVRDASPRVRVALLEGLADECRPRAPDVVTAAAADTEAKVRLRAIAALPHCLDRDARKAALTPLLVDPAPAVRAAALESLGAFAPKEDDTLAAARSALSDEAPEVRVAALGVVGNAQKKDWMETLGGALDDPAPEVRQKAVEHLRFEKKAGAYILTALRDEDVSVRRAALLGLEAKDPALVARLETLRKDDPDMLVRSFAESALRKAGAYSGPPASPFTEGQLPAHFRPLFVFPGTLPQDVVGHSPNPGIFGRYTAVDRQTTPQSFLDLAFEKDEAGRLFYTSWGLREEARTGNRFETSAEFPEGRSLAFWGEDGGFHVLGWSRSKQYESWSVQSFVLEGDTLTYTQRTETAMAQDPALAALQAALSDPKQLAQISKQMGVSAGPKTQYYEAAYAFRRVSP